jgi:hypothetical protein
MKLKVLRDIIDAPHNTQRYFEEIERAMSGNIQFAMTPATGNALATSQNEASYTRKVKVQVVDSAGNVHRWFQGTIALTYNQVTAGDGAITGPATVQCVDGEAEIEVTYTGTFANGVEQVETAVIVVATTTTAGTITITVTSALLAEAEAVAVETAEGDDANAVATKVRDALSANANISEHFTVSGADANVVLTAKVASANDATLNIASVDTDTVGITADDTSDNTTAGVAPDTNTVSLTQQVILGVTCTAKTSVETSI